MEKKYLETFLKIKKEKNKPKNIQIKKESEIVEVVEKTILIEDGRQLLND